MGTKKGNIVRTIAIFAKDSEVIKMKKGFKVGFNGNIGITAGLQGNTNTNTNTINKT